MLKGQKGITLVALVITIIVLVILVGVSVSVAINTGIITNSRTAVDKYNTTQNSEKTLLNTVEDALEDEANMVNILKELN